MDPIPKEKRGLETFYTALSKYPLIWSQVTLTPQARNKVPLPSTPHTLLSFL